MVPSPPLSPLREGCDITRARPHSSLFIPHIVSGLCVLCGSISCDIVATITPLLRSMEGTYHGHVFIVVLGAHLVLSVFAALGICVG